MHIELKKKLPIYGGGGGESGRFAELWNTIVGFHIQKNNFDSRVSPQTVLDTLPGLAVCVGRPRAPWSGQMRRRFVGLSGILLDRSAESISDV